MASRSLHGPALLFWLVLAVAAASAQAQTWPARAIHLIVPFPAGGGTDVAARLVGASFSDQWKQAVVVENRPGGSQLVAGEVARGAPADGYTLLMYSDTLPSEDLISKTSFNLLRDFQSIARICGSGLMLAVPISSPDSTLAAFLDRARANPGKLNEAAVSATGIPDLRRLWADRGLNIVLVPYKGTAGAMGALAAGEADISGFSPLSVQPQVRGGKVKLLAYSDAERHPQYPNVPTIAEVVGSADYTYIFYFALAALNGVPADIIQRVNVATVTAVNSPALQPKFDELGMRTYRDSPEKARAADEAKRRTAERLIAAGFLKPER